jgi:iron complex transport system ATP-binding protein
MDAGGRETMLAISGVGAAYGTTRILHDVSFDVARGEFVALLGPNGCGKTTLLRVLGRLLPLAEGSVQVVGRDLATIGPGELARILASVAQVQRTTFPFAVIDVLLTGRMPYVGAFASPRERDVSYCREVLDWFGIRHLEHVPVTRLSGGERQLVMIARALAQAPRILLLDEPTTYLDLRNQLRVLQTIERLARTQDLTVLMTIHDPNQAYAHADRAVLLRKLGALEGDVASGGHDGRSNTVAIGDPAAVLTPEHVLAAYGVEVGILFDGDRRLLVPRGA